jgi:hypothetical protein
LKEFGPSSQLQHPVVLARARKSKQNVPKGTKSSPEPNIFFANIFGAGAGRVFVQYIGTQSPLSSSKKKDSGRAEKYNLKNYSRRALAEPVALASCRTRLAAS